MFSRVLNNIPVHLKFVSAIFALGIICFTIARLIFLLVHFPFIEDGSINLLLQALFIGFRFDSVVSGYILTLPLLFLTILSFLKKDQHRFFQQTIFLFLTFAYGISLFICFADIPYFAQFNSRITFSALQWMNTPSFVFKMVLQDMRFYPYLVLCIVFIYVFIFLVKKIQKRFGDVHQNNFVTRTIGSSLLFSILAFLLLFIAIRGRVAEKSPIRWGTAFFSTHPFLNQLGLNPVYTFVRSWLDTFDEKNKSLRLINDDIAIKNVQHELGISTPRFDSPIARSVISQAPQNNLNIVLIIMEGISARRMKRNGDMTNVTPALDSLAEISLTFDNFYSAGIHTFNGVYSTLFGFSSLLHKHPMSSTESMQQFTGIASTLLKHNYQTLFFTTHDEQFDNMGGFLGMNGFQTIISQKDYPSEKVLSTLGVPDHFLFEYSLSYLKKNSLDDRPFLAVYLTGSNHGPYIIPDDIAFKPHSKKIEDQTLEYADWSLRYFFEKAKNESWYRNTIFVFVSDHGAFLSSKYPMDLSHNHIPFIIHSPANLVEKKMISNVGGQIDVFPTLMGLLGISFVNNTVGIDLLNENRQYIYFNDDNSIGCLDEKYFLVIPREGKETIFRYREEENAAESIEVTTKSVAMKSYVYSQLQTTQWLIAKRKVGEQSAKPDSVAIRYN